MTTSCSNRASLRRWTPQWCFLLGCIFASSSLTMLPVADAASAAHFRGSPTQQQDRPLSLLNSISPPQYLGRRRVMEEKQEEEEEEEEEEEQQQQEEATSTTQAPTVRLTESSVFDSKGEATDDNGLILLPFIFQVQGTHLLGSTNEIVFRWHLQEYLTNFFASPLLEVSTVFESIQLDRPWMTTVEGRRRELQDETLTSTTSNNNGTNIQDLRLEYQGRALLKDTPAFFDTQPTLDMIYEAQIVALEDTAALQEYFVQLLFQDEVDDENLSTGPPQPVVFIEVQVEGRPLLQLDPAVAWDRIEALNSTQTSSSGEVSQQKDDNSNKDSADNQDTNASQSNNMESSALSALATAFIIGVTLVLSAIAGAIFCMLRARRQRQMLTKLPGAPDVHAMEVASDADSEGNLDDIVYDKSLLRQQKNSSPTMTRTSSWCEEDDGSGAKGGGSKMGLSALERVSSLFRKSSSKQSSSNEILDEEEGIEAFPPLAAVGSGETNTSSSRSSSNGVTPDEDVDKEKAENMKIFPHGPFDDARLAAPSLVIDLTASGRNSSGIEVVEKEAPKAAPRSVLSSPPRKPSQQEHDELDSVVANMNLCSNTSYDDESMMGYSLASNSESVVGNNKQQLNVSQETEVSVFTSGTNIRTMVHGQSDTAEISRQVSGDDGDSSNSDPSTRISMLPGVQNLLNSSAKQDKPKNSSSSKKWRKKKNRPQGFFSSDSESLATLEHVLEEASAQSDSSGSVFIEDDAESVEVVDITLQQQGQILAHHDSEDEASSSYKEFESMKGSDSSVISEIDNVADMSGSGGLSALGYYNRDQENQARMIPQITPVPSEEMEEMVPKTPVIANSGLGLMSSNVIRDDVSDAPSDELNTNIVTAAMQSSLMDNIRHTPSVDSDPAVVDYLMRERRQRTRRKRATRKQPPVTMEV